MSISPRVTEILELAFDSATGKLKTSVDLNAADIEIGAVEIKNATTDTRLIVNADGTIGVKSGGKTSSASQTRPNNQTPYDINDVVGTDAAAVMELTNVSAVAGSTILITGAHMRIDVNAVPSGMGGFLVHLFNAAPTAITDNLAYNLIAADRAKYLGSIIVATPVDFGDTLWSENAVSKEVTLATGSTSLFAVTTTLSAFTPSASTVKTLILNAMEV